MATTVEFIDYVCEQVRDAWAVRYKKMFGEYMVYINDKPILLVCDNTVYVKKHPSIQAVMEEAASGTPYQGAKEHYILDIDDAKWSRQIIELLEPVTPVPKPRTKKK